MAQNKKNITSDNIKEWLSSTGFLFPRNEVELARFEKIYGDEDLGLTGNEIDPAKILNGQIPEISSLKIPLDKKDEEITPYRMAARNGNHLPKHIMDRIHLNQSKENDDDDTSEENSNK